MDEDTLDGQPDASQTPGVDGPEANPQPDQFDAVAAQMNAEKAQKIRQDIGEDSYVAMRKQIEAEIAGEFSQADNRDYKDLDGVRKTFTERAGAHEARVKAEKELAEINGSEEDGGANEGGEKKVEKPPLKKEEPQAPNGAVNPTLNALAVREIVRTNPEFIHVQKQVETVAEANSVSVLDVWENKDGAFEAYGFKAQATFAESKIRAEEASKKRNQAMPSSGAHASSNKATVTMDQIAKKKDSLSAEEIDRMVDEGRLQ